MFHQQQGVHEFYNTKRGKAKRKDNPLAADNLVQAKWKEFLATLDHKIQDHVEKDIHSERKKQEEKDKLEQEKRNFLNSIQSQTRRQQFYVDPRTKTSAQGVLSPAQFLLRKTFQNSLQQSMRSNTSTAAKSPDERLSIIARPATDFSSRKSLKRSGKKGQTRISSAGQVRGSLQNVLSFGRVIPHSQNLRQMVKESQNLEHHLNTMFMPGTR